jgi:hypothetical protein
MGPWPRFDPRLTQVSVTGLHARMKGSRAPNLVSPVARPGSPFIALDMLISSGFDTSPWVRVRFPTGAEKILNLNGPRSENRQWGDICPNASGDEWNSLSSATLICISGVREYQYRNARGQVTGDR